MEKDNKNIKLPNEMIFQIQLNELTDMVFNLNKTVDLILEMISALYNNNNNRKEQEIKNEVYGE